VRNRERVLEAARKIFNRGAAEASLEAVAQRAGVGIGTLYRHFPTREALFETVYRREVQLLVNLADQLQDAPSFFGAVRQWVHALVDFVAGKKGPSAGLAIVGQRRSTLASGVMEQMAQALGSLLQRAAARGDIRNDVGAEEILQALLGICCMQDSLPWQRNVLRLERNPSDLNR
jgi:AcrR family transcriptional regulator